MDGCTDGSWTSEEDGQVYQFFECPDGKGLYYPLNRIHPNSVCASAKDNGKNNLIC